MPRKRNGFAAVLILSLLPIFVGGCFLIFTLLGVLQSDLKLKHICRQEGKKYQEKVLPRLEHLLSLNPRAAKLQAERLRLEVLLNAALVRGDITSVATLKARLTFVKTQQLELDIRQKQLINQSNLELLKGHRTAAKILDQEASRSSVKNLLHLQVRRTPTPSPRLAVRPDSSDLAPTYSPTPDFETEQALAQQWQYSLTFWYPLMTKPTGTFKFSKACAVTLKKETFKWKVALTKARFSLKSVW